MIARADGNFSLFFCRSLSGDLVHCYSLPTLLSCYSAEKTSRRSSTALNSCACTTWRTPASASFRRNCWTTKMACSCAKKIPPVSACTMRRTRMEMRRRRWNRRRQKYLAQERGCTKSPSILTPLLLEQTKVKGCYLTLTCWEIARTIWTKMQ